MNLSKLKYYIDLVDTGSFTKAGAINHVSQTTISHQVQALETHYDHQLIDRSTQPVLPTEAGQIVYQEAKQLWDAYQRFEATIQNRLAQQTRIRIGYTSIVELSYLQQIGDALEQEGLQVTLQKFTLKDLVTAIKSQRIDLAIGFDSAFASAPELKQKTLYEGSYHAIVGAQHPLYPLTSVTPKQLADHPWVMLSEQVIGESFQLMVQHATADGYPPVIARTADDIETELYYIRQERLLGFAPDIYVLPTDQQELRSLPITDSHHRFQIVVAYDSQTLQAYLKPRLAKVWAEL